MQPDGGKFGDEHQAGYQQTQAQQTPGVTPAPNSPQAQTQGADVSEQTQGVPAPQLGGKRGPQVNRHPAHIGQQPNRAIVKEQTGLVLDAQRKQVLTDAGRDLLQLQGEGTGVFIKQSA